MASFVIDFRRIEIDYELWALGEQLKLIERQVEAMKTEASQRVYATLRAQGFGDDQAERDLAAQELEEIVENVIPRFFRNAFLIALWAVYESAVTEIASHLQKAQGKTRELRDIKGRNTLDKLEKYYQDVLDLHLFESPAAAKRISMLLTIRNALAHGNGRKDVVSNWKKIEEWQQANAGIKFVRDEYLTFRQAFLEEMYQTVNAAVHVLLEHLKKDHKL